MQLAAMQDAGAGSVLCHTQYTVSWTQGTQQRGGRAGHHGVKWPLQMSGSSAYIYLHVMGGQDAAAVLPHMYGASLEGESGRTLRRCAMQGWGAPNPCKPLMDAAAVLSHDGMQCNHAWGGAHMTCAMQSTDGQGVKAAPMHTFDSVLFPLPFLPMMACTSPSRTTRSTPCKMACPVATILASRPLTSSSTLPPAVADAKHRTDRLRMPRAIIGEAHEVEADRCANRAVGARDMCNIRLIGIC